jgi:hypothetical protein
MSQIHINVRERATLVGEETTFGVVPSGSFPNAMTRCFALGDDLIVGDLAEEMLPVMDEKVRRFDAQQPVHGLKIASKVGGLKCLLKAVPTASQLTAAGTVGPLTPRILLRHALGAEHAALGSTVASAASASVFDVTDATLFQVGTFILVAIAGEMEWTKIISLSGSTLTVSPALSATPATSAVVRNLYNYCPAEANDKSLCVQQRFAGETVDEETSHTVMGCYGDLSFDLPEFGKLPSMTLGLTATNYQFGVTSPAIGVGSATDEMGASFAWKPSVYLSTGLINRATTLVCEGATIAFSDAVEMVRDPSATQTVHSIVRTGGNPSAVKLGIKLRFDSSYDATFTTDTAYRCVIVQKIGTGLTASFWIWELPNAKLAMQPKRTKIGSRLNLELAFNGFQDTSILSGGSDFFFAPLRVCFG